MPPPPKPTHELASRHECWLQKAAISTPTTPVLCRLQLPTLVLCRLRLPQPMFCVDFDSGSPCLCRLRLRQPLLCVDFDSDSHWFVSTSTPTTLRLCRLRLRRPLFCVDFDSDSHWFVSTSTPTTLRLCRLRLRRFLFCVDFDSDSHWSVSTSTPTTLRLCRLRLRQPLFCVDFDSDNPCFVLSPLGDRHEFIGSPKPVFCVAGGPRCLTKTLVWRPAAINEQIWNSQNMFFFLKKTFCV